MTQTQIPTASASWQGTMGWHEAVQRVAAEVKPSLSRVLHTRLERAVQIAQQGGVEPLPDGTARVASQSHGQTTYVVCNGVCECEDFKKATEAEAWCKHRLAYVLHQRARAALALPADPVREAVEQAERVCREAVETTPPPYRGFLTFLPQKKRVAGTKAAPLYAEIRQPYLTVDGRIKIARDDHREQGASLVIQTGFETEPGSQHLLCKATVTSAFLGSVTAHARVFLGGAGVNASNPLENAETSAVGRALGFLGYGLCGTGIASAEEVLQAVAVRETASEPETLPGVNGRAGAEKPPSERQVGFLRKLLAEAGSTEEEIAMRVAGVATSHEASQLIDQLRVSASSQAAAHGE